MSSYDWRDYEDRACKQRFLEWSQGFTIWRAQASVERVMVDLFEARRALVSRPPRARIFVSHRQADILYFGT
jgi:hypothetical protein